MKINSIEISRRWKQMDKTKLLLLITVVLVAVLVVGCTQGSGGAPPAQFIGGGCG